MQVLYNLANFSDEIIQVFLGAAYLSSISYQMIKSTIIILIVLSYILYINLAILLS
jgi:hypothetical protein